MKKPDTRKIEKIDIELIMESTRQDRLGIVNTLFLQKINDLVEAVNKLNDK